MTRIAIYKHTHIGTYTEKKRQIQKHLLVICTGEKELSAVLHKTHTHTSMRTFTDIIHSPGPYPDLGHHS